MINFFFSTLLTFIFFLPLHSKETHSKICYKRGIEIILPYEYGVENLKKLYSKSNNILKKELINYKIKFEKNFYGLELYESSGCSKARLSEYLNCLILTDGNDCKIYYTQMRLVD